MSFLSLFVADPSKHALLRSAWTGEFTPLTDQAMIVSSYVNDIEAVTLASFNYSSVTLLLSDSPDSNAVIQGVLNHLKKFGAVTVEFEAEMTFTISGNMDGTGTADSIPVKAPCCTIHFSTKGVVGHHLDTTTILADAFDSVEGVSRYSATPPLDVPGHIDIPPVDSESDPE